MIECKNCGHGKTAHLKNGCKQCYQIWELLGQEDEFLENSFCSKFELDNLAYVEKCYDRQKKKQA